MGEGWVSLPAGLLQYVQMHFIQAPALSNHVSYFSRLLGGASLQGDGVILWNNKV